MENEIIIYQTQDGKTKIDVKIEDETVETLFPFIRKTLLTAVIWAVLVFNELRQIGVISTHWLTNFGIHVYSVITCREAIDSNLTAFQTFRH